MAMAGNPTIKAKVPAQMLTLTLTFLSLAYRREGEIINGTVRLNRDGVRYFLIFFDRID
jgi:hypothetical protein